MEGAVFQFGWRRQGVVIAELARDVTPTSPGGEKSRRKHACFAVSPLQTGKAGLASPSMHFWSVPYNTQRPEKDSPAAYSESPRGSRSPHCAVRIQNSVETRSPIRMALDETGAGKRA